MKFNKIKIEEIKTKINYLKAEIENLISDNKENEKPVELNQALFGRLSRMDAIQQQELALETKRRRENILIQINNALTRLENGSYGKCFECDEYIPEKRLIFDPLSIKCINCLQED